MIEIVSAGPLMTIQDIGRFGYAEKGISQSGVLDRKSMSIINALLGNDINEAVIEMTMAGGEFKFHDETFFSLGGADMNAQLNGQSLKLYKVYKALSNDILKLGYAKKGCHGYVGFGGGIDVPIVMGSKSTNLKCGFGGLNGRKLAVGDVLETGIDFKKAEGLGFSPENTNQDEIYVVLGAQAEMFTQKGIDDFFSCEYTISQNYDRMGCRLEGCPVESINGMDIISDGIAFGSIQISSNGMPIIMLSDRQTIGGYAKIGSIATVDIPKFVQHKPGEKIRFKKISMKNAQKLYKKEQKIIQKLIKM